MSAMIKKHQAMLSSICLFETTLKVHLRGMK